MIIFLDIDGVLNHTQMDFDLPEVAAQAPYVVDPKNVEVLENLVRHLDATIVISSTWRILNEREFFREKLGGYLYDRLEPDWRTNRLNGIRGLEIQDWIQRNRDTPTSRWWSFKEYLILDDDQDFLWYQPLIHINHKYGLTIEDADTAIASKGVRIYRQ